LNDGTEVTGSISIPEIAHDTDPDDYVASIYILCFKLPHNLLY
jgi:hypothetical protein